PLGMSKCIRLRPEVEAELEAAIDWYEACAQGLVATSCVRSKQAWPASSAILSITKSYSTRLAGHCCVVFPTPCSTASSPAPSWFWHACTHGRVRSAGSVGSSSLQQG